MTQGTSEMRKQHLAARALFKPKMPEATVQCVSCPFGKDNDKEFGAIALKLAQATGLTTVDVRAARMSVHMDIERSGEFWCHGTVYTNDLMGRRPQSEHRQCPGATNHHRTHLPGETIEEEIAKRRKG